MDVEMQQGLLRRERESNSDDLHEGPPPNDGFLIDEHGDLQDLGVDAKVDDEQKQAPPQPPQPRDAVHPIPMPTISRLTARDIVSGNEHPQIDAHDDSGSLDIPALPDEVGHKRNRPRDAAGEPIDDVQRHAKRRRLALLLNRTIDAINWFRGSPV